MAEFKIKDGVAIILEGTTEIEENAFYNDTSLECVVIPIGVTEIGKSAFEGCKNLTSIVIPKGVSEIGESAFEGCTSLTTVILPFSVNNIGNNTFKECLKLTAICVPAEKVDHYKKCLKTCLPGKLHHIIKPVVKDMLWEKAIRKVLDDEGKPMHYREIMKKIIKNGYRIDYGNHPDGTVNSRLSSNTISSKNSKSKKLFEEVEKGKGFYTLADTSSKKLFEEVEKGKGVYTLAGTSAIPAAPEAIPKKTVDSAYKKASDFIKSTVLSPLVRELLELIVNFPLPLAEGVVCFADILDNLEVKFSDEDKKPDKTIIDKALLEKKLEELKKQIAEIRKKAEYNHQLSNNDGAMLERMPSLVKEVERLLADSGDKVVVSVQRLGEFIPGRVGKDKPKVVIYLKSIENYLKSIEKNLKSDENRLDVMAAVFVHEMFHAWNYFKAEQKPRSVLAIDEPMVEFETLYFLKELETFADSRSHHLKDKVSSVSWDSKMRVRNKQISIGDMAAYGFGYYLFTEFEEGNVDPIKWIETYSKKSASISRDSTVKNVEKALIPVYPFSSENDVMKLFKKIIFSRRATLATTGMSTATKIGLDVSLHDLVLACIKTIGRKCFDAQELYAFAPIFEVCVPQYQNLESALKQQLDELVKEGRLESLPHSFYSMK